MVDKKRIGVVGSGVSGLSAAWLLTKNGHSVTLFEKDPTAGGHTLTDFSGPVPVDLGFQVYNLTTYPHFVGFLECLEVETEPSDMSFALSLDRGQLEWASHGLGSIFAQKKNLINPQFWLMIYQVLRFGREAPKVLLPERASEFQGMTLGTYLERERYGEYFKKFYVLPMCAAVWSVSFNTVLEFPIVVLVRFWVNHHLLDILQRPVWRVVKNRSVSYVNKVLQELSDVRLNCEVLSVESDSEGVMVETLSGKECFDAVIMATHSDVSLKLLGNSATLEEREILSAIPYASNAVYLHTDAALMPKRMDAWASWNLVASSNPASESDAVCVSYWLNRLQNLDPSLPQLFVTLNPPSGLPESDSVIQHVNLFHPVFSVASAEAQERLDWIQGVRGIYYAGAWCGYGFHEDGIRSAVAVAEQLDCSIPWTPRSLSPKMSLLESFWLRTFDTFAQRGLKRGSLRVILPNGSELNYGDGQTDPLQADAWRDAPKLAATMRVFDAALFKKIVFKTDTGLAEGFMDEEFAVDDMGSLMAIMAANAAELTQNQCSLGVWGYCGDWMLFLGKSLRSNTIKGSRDNISKHYDMGNAFYKLFLDSTMTYSAALYTPSSSLQEAQERKLDDVLRLLDIQKQDHVLEIGCGWGSFALRAAQKTGCRVTGVTLSREQLREGHERVKAAGLDHLIQLLFCDYRHIQGFGVFDKVVSIEMIEAVGHEHLDTYFRTISRVLKPGGKVYLQAITVPDERYAAYCASSDFVREYIFPGGHLPCMKVINSLAVDHGMAIQSATAIGLDYALTLREWRHRWVNNREQLMKAGCSTRQHRIFEMYFAYCEAGFDAGYIDTYQITLQKAPDRLPQAPVEEFQTADHFTQALLAIYFFLAGIVVTNRPYMWLTPIASLALVLLFAFWRNISSFFRFYRRMQSTEKIWWTTRVVRSFYSLFMAILATSHILIYGRHQTLEEIPNPQQLAFYCSPLCVTLGMRDSATPLELRLLNIGFCGFQVWNLVYHRLYTARPLLLVRYTVMLMFLGTAAFKVEQVGVIAWLLMAEWNTFFDQLLQGSLCTGAVENSLPVRCLSWSEKTTFVLFKLVWQFGVVLDLVLSESVWSFTWSHCVLVLIVSFSCLSNLKRVVSSNS